MKKILSILLAAFIIFSLGACGPNVDIEPIEKIDTDKTQLYVGVFDGACGYEWLTEYKRLYEQEHSDVQIIIDNKKDDYDSILSSKMPTSRQDMYFLSHNSYKEFLDNNCLEDITDTVTAKIYDDELNLVGNGGTQSIIDSMFEDFEAVYNMNGHYYAIPNFVAPAGIIYDADLFEEYGYSVPQTYNELISLMDQMLLTNEITPFTFSNMLYICSNVLSGIWASYEGASDYNLNNTFNGTDSTLGPINMQNGYLLQQQEGRKAALKFAYDLMSKSSYTTSKARAGLGHESAQQNFVGSVKVAADGGKSVAMFIESSYWETEVKNYMQSLASLNPDWGYGKRNFKFMSFPTFTGVEGIADQTNTKNTIYCANARSMVCINRASTKKDIAKDFLQFCQQRKCLSIYVKYSSALRPYYFKATNEEYAEFTPFMQSIYDLTQDENTEFCFHTDACDVKRRQNTEFGHEWAFMTQTSKAVTDNPITAFYTNSSLTVDEYFAGMSTYWTEARWRAL